MSPEDSRTVRIVGIRLPSRPEFGENLFGTFPFVPIATEQAHSAADSSFFDPAIQRCLADGAVFFSFLVSHEPCVKNSLGSPRVGRTIQRERRLDDFRL